MRNDNCPIAIVGIGGIFPDALTPEQLWTNIAQRRNAAREVPENRWPLPFKDLFDPVARLDHVYSTRGCYLQDCPLETDGLQLDRELLEALDPVFRIALYAARQALRDANPKHLDWQRAGVIIGNIALPNEHATALTVESLGSWFAENVLGHPSPSFPLEGGKGRAVSTHPLNRYVVGMVAGIIAQAYGLGGGSCAVDGACAASLYALKFAVDELASGRADLMLTGGVARPDCLYTQMGFSQLRALSPTGVCAPFDAQGNGLVVGEGAGLVALKRLADALADGDHIYAVIRGIGLSNDRQGALLAPDSEGQLRAMQAAYEQAGWSPQDVELIECHATGTPVGDAVEFASLQTLWGESGWQPGQCVIGSVKSNIGHLLTGAGAAGLIKVILALQHQTLPPTANFTTPGPKIDLLHSPFRVLTASEPWQPRTTDAPRRAAVSAFGFGGINAHVLLEEWQPSNNSQFAIDNSQFAIHNCQLSIANCQLPITEPIAIVGMGVHFGPWDSLRKFQEHVLGTQEVVEPFDRGNWWGIERSHWFKTAGFAEFPWKGWYLDQIAVLFDQFRIPPKELEEALPQQVLMLQVAAQAFADISSRARLPKAELDALALRSGVFIGLGLDLNTTNFALRWQILQQAQQWALELGLALTEAEFEAWVQSLRDHFTPPLTANRTVGALGGMIASRIAREFHCGGPSIGIASEESSGLQALAFALRALRQGEIDQALVGAVDLQGDVRAVLNTHALRAFSRTGKALPFDLNADGSLPGEGAAAIALKRLSDARRDGDRIYAVIKGIGTASGQSAGKGVWAEGRAVPGANAYQRALAAAYADAGIDPAAIEYLETHGSGSPREDQSEIEALTAYFSNPLLGGAGGGFPVRPLSAWEGPGVGNIPNLPPKHCALGSVKADIGHTGIAAGLASLVKTCLCLYQEIIPAGRNGNNPVNTLAGTPFYFPADTQYWLRNRADGPRRAAVSALGIEGNCVHVVLEAEDEGHPQITLERRQPTGVRPEALFALEAENPQELGVRLEQLRTVAEQSASLPIESLARQWWERTKTYSPTPGPSQEGKYVTIHSWEGRGVGQRRGMGIAFVASERGELLNQLRTMQEALVNGRPAPLPGSRIFYRPEPLGGAGKIAFVFPGSGNHYPGMGREIGVQWPEILRQQDRRNHYLRRQYAPEILWNETARAELNRHYRDILLGQVAYSTLLSDLLRSFGVRPQAVIGYSLGESAGLFALAAWPERDEMLRRMMTSSLFIQDLAGETRVARQAWKLRAEETADWMLAAVQCSADRVQAVIREQQRVYLLIIDTPGSCIIGGQRQAVLAALQRLDGHYHLLEGVSVAHCELLHQVAEPYRQLHFFSTTTAPAGIAFYSTAWGRAYDVTPNNAADAILAMASATIDFPTVIQQAYEDGVRVFLEIGPGTTCTRMIGEILVGQPHLACSACAADNENAGTILRLLGTLIAEGIPVDLTSLYGQETRVVGHQLASAAAPRKMLHLTTGGQPFSIDNIPKKCAAVSVAKAREALPENVPLEPRVVNVSADSPEPEVNFPETGVNSQLVEKLAALRQQVSATQTSNADAHAAYLTFSQGMTDTFVKQAAFQMSLLEALLQTTSSGHECPGSELKQAEACSEDASASLSFDPGALAPGTPGLVFLNREQCLEFAVGSIAKVLGAGYAEVERYPTRVRLPDEPLMLVDRILAVTGEPRALSAGGAAQGVVVTEHDIRPAAWYLDGGRIPTCIAVEAGQADLFLAGYLGIDLITRGLAVYRLLDAVVTFHDAMPGPGQVIRYAITIEEFFRQGATYLFHFHFESTIAGKPFLSMQNGCAGFFTPQELASGQGLVFTEMDLQPQPGRKPADWQAFVPLVVESYSDDQLQALRNGDLAACFGDAFAGLPLQNPCRLPGGRMKLIDRVLRLEPTGGRYGLGRICAEADIHPDDWFLTCHFVDDQVMPGTLMYECSLHALRVLLMRMGWVGEQDQIAWEPVPETPGQLKCRGQVIVTTQKVAYEIALKEIGFRPEPYAIADAVMYADQKPIVRMLNMSLQLAGMTRESLEHLWRNRRQPVEQSNPPLPLPGGELSLKSGGTSKDEKKPAIFDTERILAFAIGKPSEAFGDRYQIFDQERIIARLPGPPYQFLDRITAIEGEQWQMTAGKRIEAQYDVPVDAWYFAANQSRQMPFAVLLEIALQPCGWLAAYVGSALTSDIDLSFRNLGGSATQFLAVEPAAGTLTTTVALTNVSHSGGMIIQHYDFAMRNSGGQPVYEGKTYFGFFSKQALAQQIGLREARPYQPTSAEQERGIAFPYPQEFPFPATQLRMLDRITLFAPDGGPHGLGFIQGVKTIQPDEWFFRAHFYQDPVWPGSLGLEAFLQILKIAAWKRWGWASDDVFETPICQQPHQWTYRGQVIPTDHEVTVQAVITAIDDKRRFLEAQGFLSVDGRIIYQMEKFTLQIRSQ